MIKPLLCLVFATFLGGCSLITVPVKTAGSLAETTVRTTGSVVEAPFRARSQRSE